MGRSAVPREYDETSPLGVTRATSAFPKSHAKTLPSPSSVTPYRKPPVDASSSMCPSRSSA
jgi:hypothetical protein